MTLSGYLACLKSRLLITSMNRIAIVTGVSRLAGIGRATCLELAKDGIDIFFTYWSAYDKQMPWSVAKDEPDIIQKEIRSLGRKCEKLELDLSAPKAVDLLFEKVMSKMGTADILINNATYSTETTLENFSVSELDKHYYINVRATTLLTLGFIKQFRRSSGGRIVNLTSGQSLGQMPDELAYAITKGAAETLTTTLSQKIAVRGITINAVNPGPNDTGWMDDNIKKGLKERFPMKRLGTPQDTANLIGFLVSEKAEWVTGQIIHSEGGFVR